MTLRKGADQASSLCDLLRFPTTLDEKSGQLIFVQTTRDILARTPFHDGREDFAAVKGETAVSLQDARTLIKANTQACRGWNFIFHLGYSCSTLIAKCLDREGVATAIKEPAILTPFTQRKSFLCSPGQIEAFRNNLGLCIDFLARVSPPGEGVVVKPSNIDTVLAGDIAALNPEARIVFLYSSLREFLIAVAKGGQPRRVLVRRLLAHLVADLKTRHGFSPYVYGIRENNLWNLSDLHIAAAVWHLHMNLMKETGPADALWVDCSDFLADPEGTLKILDGFFGFDVPDDVLNDAHLREAFSCHAKTPNVPFGIGKREGEHNAIGVYLEPALNEIALWADRTFSANGCYGGQRLAG